MGILSGIKLVANQATYGKLIGVSQKSGIKVFERIDEYGCKHITSIGRDGNVRKKILKSPDIETVVDNLVTGERVNIRNGKTSFSLTRRSKDGAVERYFKEPWINEVNLVFGEGENMLKLSAWRNPSSKDVTFIMNNKKDFNLNGTLIPHGYTHASVNADGKTIGKIKEVFDISVPHDKNLVQSVFSAVHKLLKI